MVQVFLETEVVKIVGAQFVAQEGGELLVLLQERVLEIGAMTMLDLIDNGGKLADIELRLIGPVATSLERLGR
jgi:hypothetical protein